MELSVSPDRGTLPDCFLLGLWHTDRGEEFYKNGGMHFNGALIHHRITMEWMRKLGLDYNQYYTKQWNPEFLMSQKYQVKTTVLYSQIDPDIRGKAIGSFSKKF